MQIGYPVPNFSPSYSAPCFCRSGNAFGECCGSRAPERKLPAGVQLFSGFTDADTCRKWVARLERQPRERAPVTNVNKSSHKAPLYEGRVCDDVKPGVLRNKIHAQVRKGFSGAVQITGRNLEWFEIPRILRYQPGGHYERHSDSCQVIQNTNYWFKVRDRDLSLLLYLNEDYTGGGLTFIHFNFHFRPRTGDLLVFPSDNRYEHRAEKVTSGLRYAVASWAAFTGTQRVFDDPPPGAIHI